MHRNASLDSIIISSKGLRGHAMRNLHCIPAFLIANPIMILISTIIKEFPPLEAPRFSVVGESTVWIGAWFDILSIMFISPVASIGGFGAGVSESHVSTHFLPFSFAVLSYITRK
jgi:hypothetical protein